MQTTAPHPKINGFEALYALMTSEHTAAKKKARRMYLSFGSQNKDRFIRWLVQFQESDFVTETSFEEQKEDVEYLVSEKNVFGS